MTDIQRFMRFIFEIANSDKCEYENGDPMSSDAKEFLESLSELPACCDICMEFWRDCTCEKEGNN